MNKPMRILFITNLYPPLHIGGYEIACKDIAEGFMERGHTVRVLTSTYGLHEPSINQHIARLLDIRLKFNAPQTLFEKSIALFLNPLNYKITKNHIEEFNPDIVSFWNINGISSSTILAVEKLGIPKVFHLFDRGLSYLRKIGIKSVVNHLLYSRLHINHLISSSNELKKDYVSRGFDKDSITVIPHGIDIRNFPFKKKKIDGTLKLLYVGQLWEGKGVHLLLKAAGLLKKKNVDFFLTVIGKGEQSYAKLLHCVCEKENIVDNVQFLGRIDRQNLIQYYHKNHILVFPSVWKEPFGIVLLETMATGTSVVSSGYGGPVDIIKDGETGFFFKTGDFRDIAYKILLFENDRQLIREMGKKSRDEVVKNFKIENVIDKIKSLYLKVYNINASY